MLVFLMGFFPTFLTQNETKDKIKGIDKEIDILLINMQNYDMKILFRNIDATYFT